jgi:hypothetical protein
LLAEERAKLRAFVITVNKRGTATCFASEKLERAEGKVHRPVSLIHAFDNAVPKANFHSKANTLYINI